MQYDYTIMPSSTSPYSTVTRKRRFDSNQAKYRCCCGGKCHVRTGAMFVGGVEIIIICLLMITASVWFVYDGRRRAHELRYGLNRPKPHGQVENTEDDRDQPAFEFDRWSIIGLVICLAVGLLFLITVPFLFAGVIGERRCLLWPHMIAQWALIVIFFALLVYSIIFTIFAAEAFVSLADEESVPEDNRRHRAIKRLVLYSLQTAACLIAILVFVSFFNVVHTCYNYFRDYELYEKTRRYSTNSSPNSTMNGRQTVIIETSGLLAGVKYV